ncbi:Gar1 RNA binding region taining protein [Babesia ovis]|uniref:H/ACA ribonucleoprotein complex subunit n=1 Tax=Babesia ovis TaxID=5869 RepID=A0A9W5WV34_BABOV|nr:Gar1 RNA binding region taining protein [Babesia ovis]
MLSRGRGGGRGGGFNARRGGRGAGGAPKAGKVVHDCEDQLVIKSTLASTVPYFNGRIFLANKQEIGKVDEILGPINEYFFSVTLADGFKARSFEKDSVVYIDPQQTLPASRFIPKPGTAQTPVKKRSVIKDKTFKQARTTRGRGGSFGLGRGNSMAYRGGLSRGRGYRGRGGY